MTEFISLEEFLCLPDSSFEPERIFYKSAYGIHWVDWYNLARESFLKYGSEGPPIGSKVEALVNGHRGSGRDWERKFPGETREFGGVYEPDPRFFFLKYDKHQSLVDRKYWWREIRVIE